MTERMNKMADWGNKGCPNCGRKNTVMFKCDKCGTTGCSMCVGTAGFCKICKKGRPKKI
jgi:hypothetical protein